MGCDIHPSVEVRRNGIWKFHTPRTICPYYYEYDYVRDPVTSVSSRVTRLDADGNPIRSTYDRCKYELPEAFTSRNYEKFSFLADVRNGEGPKDPDWVEPIHDRHRGIPYDISPQARARLSNEHSPGWVTLQELISYAYWERLQEWSLREYLEMREYMTKLIPKGGTSEDVRLVFDFDS